MESEREVKEWLEVLEKFIAEIAENIQDLEPEFQQVIDENFWDLLA